MNADQFSSSIPDGQLEEKARKVQKRLSDTRDLWFVNEDQLSDATTTKQSMSFRYYLHVNSKITGNLCETHQLFYQCAIRYCTEFGVMPPPNFHEQVLWAMAASRDAGPEVKNYVLENLDGRAFSKNLKNIGLPDPLIDEPCQGSFEPPFVRKKLDCSIVGIGGKPLGMVENGHQPPLSRPAMTIESDTLILHRIGREPTKHDAPADEQAALRQHLATHAVLGDDAHESHAAYRRCAARFCLETDRMPQATFQEQVLWAMAENPLADPDVHKYVLAMLHVETAHAAVVCSRLTHDSQTTEVRPVNTHGVDAYVEPQISSHQPELANPFEELGGDVVTPRTNVAHEEPAPPSPEQEIHETLLSDEGEGCEAISVLPTVTMLEGQGFNSLRGQVQNRSILERHDGEGLHQYLLRNATKGQNAHARHAHFLRCACMYYLETNELPPADIQNQVLWAMASCSDVCRNDLEFIFIELGNRKESNCHFGDGEHVGIIVKQDSQTFHVRDVGDATDCDINAVNEPANDSFKIGDDFPDVGFQKFTDSIVSKVGRAHNIALEADFTCNSVVSTKASRIPTETEVLFVENTESLWQTASFSCSDDLIDFSPKYVSETVVLQAGDAEFGMISPEKDGNTIQVNDSIGVDSDNHACTQLDSASWRDSVVSNYNSQIESQSACLSTCKEHEMQMDNTKNLDCFASERSSCNHSCHIMPVFCTPADCECSQDNIDKQQLETDFEAQNRISGVSDSILDIRICQCIEDCIVLPGFQEEKDFTENVFSGQGCSDQSSVSLAGFGDQVLGSPVTADASSILSACIRRLLVKSQNILIENCKRTFFCMLRSNTVFMRAAKILAARLRRLLVRSQFAEQFSTANSVLYSVDGDNIEIALGEDLEIANVVENDTNVLDSEFLSEGVRGSLALSAWYKYDGCAVRFHDRNGNIVPAGRLSVVNLDTEPRFFPTETSHVDPAEPVIPFDTVPAAGLLQEDRPCMVKRVVLDSDHKGQERVVTSVGVLVKRNGVIVGVRSGGQNFSLTGYIHHLGLNEDSKLLTHSQSSHCPCYLWEGSCARCSSFADPLLSVSCNFPERLIRVQILSKVAGELEHIPLLYYAPSLTVSSKGLCRTLGVETTDHTSRLSVVSISGALPAWWYPELVGGGKVVFRNIKTGSTFVEHPCLVERWLKDLEREINESSKRKGLASMSNNLAIYRFKSDASQGIVARPSTASALLSSAHKPLPGVSAVIAKQRPATAFEAKSLSGLLHKSSIVEVESNKDEEHPGPTCSQRSLTAQPQHPIWRAAARLQGVFRGHLCRIMVLVSRRDLPTTELPLQLSILAHSMVRLPSTFQLFKRLVSSEHKRVKGWVLHQ